MLLSFGIGDNSAGGAGFPDIIPPTTETDRATFGPELPASDLVLTLKKEGDMGSGNEPENMSPDYIVGRIDALDDAQQRIAELEAELAAVNLALRNAKNNDWLSLGFEMRDDFIDMCAKKTIERARKQLNAGKEQS